MSDRVTEPEPGTPPDRHDPRHAAEPRPEHGSEHRSERRPEHRSEQGEAAASAGDSSAGSHAGSPAPTTTLPAVDADRDADRDEDRGEGPAQDGDHQADAEQPEEAERGRHWMDWWHHSHPTFAALSGFYAGMAYVILVPSIFGGLTRLIFGADTAERIFPYMLLFLLVPLGLLVYRKTRRFAEFVWIGILVTAVVVLGVAALTLWALVSLDS